MIPPSDPRQCVVLVPVGGVIDPGCEDGLRQLERRGYPVWRVRGYSAIDAARNQMATDALAQGFHELLWIDSDIVFDPNDVEKLRRHHLPLACGLYAKKSVREFACAFLPGTPQLRFGPQGGLREILYCGFGFVLTRRTLYETMQRQLRLPLCNQRFPAPLVPYFAPLVAGKGEQAWYLGEDYAFCERARCCGFAVVADTTIRLWHVGAYRFGWEEAGRDVQRFTDYAYHLGGTTSPETASETSSEPAAACPPRFSLHESVRPLPPSFPRLCAYCLTYPANRESLRQTLEDFRHGDWGEEPTVLIPPDNGPVGQPSAARNYRRALERAYEDGGDFALILEDDVRVNRWLRHNLTTNPLLGRDQCDYLGLFLPAGIAAPWQRQEPHLGYRLAKPLYPDPDEPEEKDSSGGSPGYVLSRRFIRAALERWDRLRGGPDARILAVCAELSLPLWYTCPCLVQHAPAASTSDTPMAQAADFDPDFQLEIAAGFQPPEAIPGWLAVEEGRLLEEHAAGRRVLELGTGLGRATVCLARQARQVVTIDRQDQSEAEEWSRRYQIRDRVDFRRGEVGAVVADLAERFDLAFVNIGQDQASVRRGIEVALSVLAPGGLLAAHDYPAPGGPDTRRVVDDYASGQGWQRVAGANFLRLFHLPAAEAGRPVR